MRPDTISAELDAQPPQRARLFNPKRPRDPNERPSAIRRAWARALTAFTVRPMSAAMSMTAALEMMSCRSCSFSSEVQAFVLLGLFV
jgi:hypothetical protein